MYHTPIFVTRLVQIKCNCTLSLSPLENHEDSRYFGPIQTQPKSHMLWKISNFWPQARQARQLTRHHGRRSHQLHMLRMQLLIQLRNTAPHNSSHQRSGKWHAAIQLCGRLMLGLAFVSRFVAKCLFHEVSRDDSLEQLMLFSWSFLWTTNS